jgi:hypothetical protein
MQAGWRAALLALLLCAVASCGDDEPTAPKPAELAGTWTATKDEYVSKTTSARIDIVAAGGSATLKLDAGGTFEFVEIPSGELPDTSRGDWSASGDVMTVHIDGQSGERQYDLYFSGNVLRLTGAGAWYDFGTGGEETTHNLELTR